MSLIDPDSKAVMPAEYEMFDVPSTDMTTQEIEWTIYRPIENPENGNDLRYELAASGEEYTEPTLIFFETGLQICDSQGNPITAHHNNVGFVNNTGHSVIQCVTMQLGNQIVYCDHHYPHTAYLKTLLSHGSDAINSHLQAGLFFKDTYTEMDTVGNLTVNDGGNQGLKKRASYTAEGHVAHVFIPLQTSLATMGKPIPPNVNVMITLARAKPAFCLMAGRIAPVIEIPYVAPQQGPPPVAAVQHVPGHPERAPDYTYKFIHPKLHVGKSRLAPPVALGHARGLAEKPYKYHIVHTTTRPVTINQGIHQVSLENIISGQIPKRIVYGFVKSSALNGSYAENPFNFENIGLTQTAVYVNGKSNPLTPYRPEYGAHGNWLREYCGLLKAMNLLGGNGGIAINRDEFPSGYCLYAYDLTPNQQASTESPVNLIKTGTVRIEIQLREPHNIAYSCMVFAEYDKMLKIDQVNDVYVNYAA